MNYSDSAILKVKVIGPEMVRILDKENPKDEFPKGVHVKFYNENGRITSWMDAKYAERDEKSRIVVARDSVVLYNKQNEKLETSELIWVEDEQRLYTEKFVRISQPEQGDTSYGYGFEANEDFTHFKIKRKFSAKMNVEEISKAIEAGKPTK